MKPKTMEQILQTVRDAGAQDDNNGGEDWSFSDRAITEALAQIQQLLEALFEEMPIGTEVHKLKKGYTARLHNVVTSYIPFSVRGNTVAEALQNLRAKLDE